MLEGPILYGMSDKSSNRETRDEKALGNRRQAAGCRHAQRSAAFRHGPAPAVADDTVDVTMIIYTAPGDPFWNPVIHGAEEAAKDRGVTLDIQYADSDPVKQNNLIETAIANKVDGIAVVNWIPDAFADVIAKAREPRASASSPSTPMTRSRTPPRARPISDRTSSPPASTSPGA